MDDFSGTLLVRTDPPSAHVVAAGDFDLSTTPIAVGQLNDALMSGCRDFCLDLARVTFLDAASVGMLVRLRRRVDELDGELIIANPAPRVRRVFELTGVGSMRNDTMPASRAGGSERSRRIERRPRS